MEIAVVPYSQLTVWMIGGFVLTLLGMIVCMKWNTPIGIAILALAVYCIFAPADRVLTGIAEGTALKIAYEAGGDSQLKAIPNTQVLRVKVDLALENGKIIDMKPVSGSAQTVRVIEPRR